MEKTIRNNGAIGALLDEYEKTIIELQILIQGVNSEELKQIADTNTKDLDCKSIQTILTHVVRAGYGYATQIRKHLDDDIEFIEGTILQTSDEYHEALNKMFQYNEKVFEDYPNIQLEEYNNDKKMLVRWGQRYDIEQLFEHAIVHILRHRRQIERFLKVIRTKK